MGVLQSVSVTVSIWSCGMCSPTRSPWRSQISTTRGSPPTVAKALADARLATEHTGALPERGRG